MKRKLMAVAAAALLGTAVAAFSQPYGMGPGMMGGGYGPGYGMGPGMMGGYGPGYGMGPGMMGGGYGPGYGMGPGMMGGYGPGYGMGPGMMGGNGPGFVYGLDLSAEQREKIGEIQKEFAQKHWGLMTSMHSPGGPMEQMFSGDEKAARQAYDAMAAARKQMFEAQLDMRKQVEAVLTKEQREQLQRNYRGRRGR
ncbi:MAG: Spy/CpxP family protein refolding chaperone [Burkholderiales bacterium]